MFIRTGTLELLNTRTQLWVGFGTYKALEEHYKNHLIAKADINKFFGLNAENNYRLYLDMPEEGDIEVSAIVKKIKSIVIKLSPKTIQSISYVDNRLIFKDDKNMYKLSRIINQLLKDNIKAFKPIITYINSYGLYPFPVTMDNINTCICDLKGNSRRKVIITTNFEDFILSSNQTSWGNCTRLGGGYESAPRVLALDSCTFIAGVVNKLKFETTFCNRWISRRWGYKFNDHIFGLNRVFGSITTSSVNPITQFISVKLNDMIPKMVTVADKFDIISNNSTNYLDNCLDLYDFNNGGSGGRSSWDDARKRINKIQVGGTWTICPMCNRDYDGICDTCYRKIRDDYKHKRSTNCDGSAAHGSLRKLFNSQFNAKTF